MKTRTLSALLLLCAFAACKKEDDNSTTPPATRRVDTLSTNITSNTMLDAAADYIINGHLFVKNNATLTIPAGVTVYMAKNDAAADKSTLVITKGSKIFINGTVDNPVVFTSAASTKTPGDWGALIILGNAPTNTGTGHVAGLDASDDTQYGGNDAADNSGSINYLRLEYPGGINPDAEDEWAVDKASGFCLGSVGSGTVVDNVMVVHSRDDGFQFVGGTVNATHLIAYNNGDDDFDFDLGYTGKLQFLIGYRTQLTSDHALRANGFESYNDEVPTLNEPLTRPVVSNMTIIGPQGNETVDTHLNQGVYIRKGTRFVLQNSIVAEYPEGALMVCNKTRPVLLNNTGSLFKHNIVHSDTASRTFSWDKDYAVFGDSVLMNFALNETNNNTMVQNSSDLHLTTLYDAANGPNLTPEAGSIAATGADFTGDDYTGFFTPVAYRGAIGTTNWAAASKWAVWK
jgi:hypothetical protein